MERRGKPSIYQSSLKQIRTPEEVAWEEDHLLPYWVYTHFTRRNGGHCPRGGIGLIIVSVVDRGKFDGLLGGLAFFEGWVRSRPTRRVVRGRFQGLTRRVEEVKERGRGGLAVYVFHERRKQVLGAIGKELGGMKEKREEILQLPISII